MTRKYTYHRDATAAEYSGPIKKCEMCGCDIYPRLDRNGHLQLSRYKVRVHCDPCAKIHKSLNLSSIHRSDAAEGNRVKRQPTPEQLEQKAEKIRARMNDPVWAEKWYASKTSETAKTLSRLNSNWNTSSPERIAELKEIGRKRMRRVWEEQGVTLIEKMRESQLKRDWHTKKEERREARSAELFAKYNIHCGGCGKLMLPYRRPDGVVEPESVYKKRKYCGEDCAQVRFLR